METFYYHYTDKNDIAEFLQYGMYSSSSFTLDQYYDAATAGQSLGIPPPVWVLKFKNDSGFRKLTGGIVSNSNRYAGGGTQYTHSGRLKPIAKRRIHERFWTTL